MVSLIGIQKPHNMKLDTNKILFARMVILNLGHLKNPSVILNGNVVGEKFKMKKYKVKVDINDTQFWEVEAESEQEAMDNYMEGSHYHTKSHGEDAEVVEEITERK